jgi:hypothetical protein
MRVPFELVNPTLYDLGFRFSGEEFIEGKYVMVWKNMYRGNELLMESENLMRYLNIKGYRKWLKKNVLQLMVINSSPGIPQCPYFC